MSEGISPELSGITADGDSWYVVEDGGGSLRVHVLDPRDCSVRALRSARTNPYDVEDMALADNGDVWLSDTGDNDLDRKTVALHRMTSESEAELYRLTYPDGPHDAEALLLGPTGVPYIITKDPLGAAGIYRPATELVAGRTAPLEQVGSLRIRSTDTPGGPLPSGFGSVTVTGAAMSADETVVAVRTYTDAYLYPAPAGDVLAALKREPLRIPLPNEPQGEAIALTPDGTLLSASEDQRSIRAVPGAVAATHSFGGSHAPPSPRGSSDREPGEPDAVGQQESRETSSARTLLLAGALAIAIIVIAGVLRRRKR